MQCEEEPENLWPSCQGDPGSGDGESCSRTHRSELLFLPGVVPFCRFRISIGDLWKNIQGTLTGELSDIGNIAKYSGEEFDQVHLNYNQTKVRPFIFWICRQNIL